jgi:hypothetical protein
MRDENVVEYFRATEDKQVQVRKFWQPADDRYLLQVPSRSGRREWVDVDLSEEQARALLKSLQNLLDN